MSVGSNFQIRYSKHFILPIGRKRLFYTLFSKRQSNLGPTKNAPQENRQNQYQEEMYVMPNFKSIQLLKMDGIKFALLKYIHTTPYDLHTKLTHFEV